jgi:hypothetical protein
LTTLKMAVLAPMPSQVDVDPDLLYEAHRGT